MSADQLIVSSIMDGDDPLGEYLLIREIFKGVWDCRHQLYKFPDFNNQTEVNRLTL